MIEFINIVKEFHNKKNKFLALNQMNFLVKKGEIFGIIGKSGAGKSTLLRITNLLERPTQGQVLFEGLNLTSLNEKELRKIRRKIGMIFQHFNLLSQATVFKNIALPLEIAGYSKLQIQERVDYLLKVTELSHKKDCFPDQLSGGQKQRVAIARALANNPSVLLCDEATSALDAETAKSILNLLKKINKEFNVTIVLITHQIEVVKYICDTVAVMSEGSFTEISSKEEFFLAPKSLEGKNLICSHDFSHEVAV